MDDHLLLIITALKSTVHASNKTISFSKFVIWFNDKSEITSNVLVLFGFFLLSPRIIKVKAFFRIQCASNAKSLSLGYITFQ